MKKNVALIGYGYWGQKIYRYLKSSEDFHVQYVYFRGLKELDKGIISKDYGSEFVPSADIIWENENVPNVIIATPVNTHYELTRQALMKDKNVLVEKPITTDPAHSYDLLKIASERKLKLETDYTFTYSEALSRAERVVKERTLGEIESIVVTKKQLGRFLQYDVYTLLGSHCISILDMFLPIHECDFSPKPLLNTNGITTAAIVSFESKNKKCRGYIDISLHCPTRETKLIVYGQRGTLVYDPAATHETLKVVCFSRSQLSGTDKVAISTEKVYTSNENHNLQRAIKHFSQVVDNATPDNSMRATNITNIISKF